MSELATRAPDLDDDEISVRAPTTCRSPPRWNGRKATKLDIRFAGSGSLDRRSEDDLDLLKAMRLGEPVRLIVVGSISGKSFNLGSGDDEPLSFACTVKVASVEAGEIAD